MNKLQAIARSAARAAAIAAIAAGALWAAPSSAAPVTLDFNIYNSLNATQASGFSLNTTGTTFIANSGNCSPACPWNNSLYVLSLGGTLSLARTDNTLFGLSGFDGAEGHMTVSSIWAKEIRVIGEYADGSQVTSKFLLDGVNDGMGAAVDFQTFQLGSAFSGLRRVSFSGIGGANNFYTLDNIQLNDNSLRIGEVPEPGSLGLAALALLCAVAVGRRLR